MNYIYIIFLLFLFFPLKSILAVDSTPLIVEVQIAGEKSSDDFVKIYNPTDSDIYLKNYQGSYIRLVKRTKTNGKDYTIKSWSQDSNAKIPAKGYYLWANKDYTVLSNTNVITSQTIADNNGLALRLGPENTGVIIDALGWGDFNNFLFEGNPFPKNPDPNQKLERKKVNGIYQDTNNNALDFYLSPLPKPETTIFLQEKSQIEIKDKKREYESPKFVKEIKRIDINTAPWENLIKIVHIGKKRAQELISLRPFYSLEELTKIKGINSEQLEDIKKQGMAWVDQNLTKLSKIEKEANPLEKRNAAAETFKQEYSPNRKNFKSFSVFLIALVIAIFSGIIILIFKTRYLTNSTTK